jgi:hypothetical protein
LWTECSNFEIIFRQMLPTLLESLEKTKI